ncbi:putative qde-2-interacting protein [Botrytis fragariae]|uniref:Putative qde-2-interacting protein n=1 Tax=Botrytis fragariae TaxID=1964551 RepID=A0A8H6EH04_9HELO|nr:putative qde-2-interacting protein [Botrytis fragariae]KAF5871994.1 putative qde-2-interacting protein [Botrytis fragariae]
MGAGQRRRRAAETAASALSSPSPAESMFDSSTAGFTSATSFSVTTPSSPPETPPVLVDELSKNLASTSINEVNDTVPAKPYVFIAIDLEANTHDYTCFANNKTYTRGTPTQIGISILRANGNNATLFANDPDSSAGTNYRHIKFKEFAKYRTRIGKLKAGEKVDFLYGRTEVIPLGGANSLIKKLIDDESKHGKVVLVGHAIQNDQKILGMGGINAFDALFPEALDTQAIHLPPGSKQGRSLINLVLGYNSSAETGWQHNAGNDAAWTLWVMAKKLPDILTVSESGKEMVLDNSKTLRFAPRAQFDYDDNMYDYC